MYQRGEAIAATLHEWFDDIVGKPSFSCLCALGKGLELNLSASADQAMFHPRQDGA